jgi:hypothetical protein
VDVESLGDERVVVFATILLGVHHDQVGVKCDNVINPRVLGSTDVG